MGRPRIMIDVRIFQSAKIVALANRQKLGWFWLLCEAKQQDTEGVFSSKAALVQGSGQFKDCIPNWMEVGLLHYGDGLCPKCLKAYGNVLATAVVVHDWHDYQEPSRWTKWRGAQQDRTDDAPPTAPNPAPVVAPVLQPPHARAGGSESVSLSKNVPEGVQGEPADPVVAYANLAGGYPSKKAMDWIDQLSATWGGDAVIRALGTAASRVTPGQVIGEAVNVLRAGERELSKREKEAEAAKVSARRLDDMKARRLEFFHFTGEWKAEWGEVPAA